MFSLQYISKQNYEYLEAYMRFFIAVIISLLCFVASLSQVPEINHKLGIYGGVNLNSHTADFYKLEGIPNCCPAFEDGSGMRFNAGILYENLLSNHFWLGARFGVMTLDGEMNKSEPIAIITHST